MKASADLVKGEWDLRLAGRQWRVAGLRDLDVELGMHGNPELIELREATVRGSQWLAAGAGTYDLTSHTLTGARAVVRPTAGSTIAQVVDDLAARFEARGTISPLDLQLTAAVSAQAITARQWRSRTGVDHVLSGRLTREALDLDVDDLPLLGGRWSGRLRYPLADGLAVLTLAGRDVDIGQIVAMLNGPTTTGLADLRIEGQLTALDTQAMNLRADAELRDMVVGPLLATRGQATVWLHDGLLELTMEGGRSNTG
jgi:hypothetical protein